LFPVIAANNNTIEALFLEHFAMKEGILECSGVFVQLCAHVTIFRAL